MNAHHALYNCYIYIRVEGRVLHHEDTVTHCISVLCIKLDGRAYHYEHIATYSVCALYNGGGRALHYKHTTTNSLSATYIYIYT